MSSSLSIEVTFEDLLYPQWVQDKIDACPTANGGLHDYLPVIASAIRHYMDADEGERFLYNLSVERGHDRKKARSEARELRKKWDTVGTEFPPHPFKVQANPERIDRIVIEGSRHGNLARMRDLSPVRLSDDERHTDSTLARLFLPDELIYATEDAEGRCGGAQTLDGWRKNGWTMSDFAYIVANPLTSQTPTEGHKIPRSDDNVLVRRFIVVEFDISPFGRDGQTPTFWRPLIGKWEKLGISTKDAQACLVSHLYTYNPDLALVIDSGGKSLHAWFSINGRREQELQIFMRYAISMGADRAITRPSQLFRMPDGTRDNGKRQVIHYCDYGAFPNTNPKQNK